MRIPLFDIDGTLAFSGNIIHSESFDFVLKTFYKLKNASRKQITKTSGMIDSEILLKLTEINGLSESLAKEQLQPALQAMGKYYSEHKQRVQPKLMPGTMNILNTLRKNNIPLGLLTGNVEEVAWGKLKQLGVDEYFSFGAFGDMALKRVELVELARIKAERALGRPISLKDLVIVGDSPRDVACAKEAGIASIAIGAGKFSYNELSVFNPDLTLHSFEEVDKFMDFIQNR